MSNHARVLLCLARNPDARVRDVADRVGITERAVQRIVRQLEGSGAVTRVREGRRNHYEIDASVELGEDLEDPRTVGALLSVLLGPDVARRGEPDSA